MLNTFCKMPLWEAAPSLIKVAQGTLPAETVICGATLVNVCTAELQEDTDVALWGGRIAYVGDATHCIGEGTLVVEADGQFLAPGFLDGHIHVESSMLTMSEYAQAVVPHGTVGIYMDPHEIANVLGLPGIALMEAESRCTPLKTMITTPSCVPAVPGFEDTGAALGPDDIRETMTWPSVVGLGEMMNFPGILAGAPAVLAECAETLKADKVVTGHYAVPETDRGLNAYIACGIRCCHESTRAEDALAKMRLGMYAMLREGSAWRDLAQLAPVIASGAVDTRFACLVSDDTHPHTLVAKGHLDHILRRAIEEGIDPITALQMVTINTATCFRMDHELGSVTPGKCADLVLLASLESFEVARVFIDGEEVAREGHPSFKPRAYTYPEWATHTMHVGTAITAETFAIPVPASEDAQTSGTMPVLSPMPPLEAPSALVSEPTLDPVPASEGATESASAPAPGPMHTPGDGTPPPSGTVWIRAIEVIPERVGTVERHIEVSVVDGCAEADPGQDVLKAFVFERHNSTGSFGYGFVKGFGITRGALASTVAHDAHNLLVLGSNDADMALAANTLIASEGGMVAVQDGRVLGHVTLPIAGLMSTLKATEMAEQVAALEEAWKLMGSPLPSPFMTMALIPLACLPELRLTNCGLVDCVNFAFAPLFVR
ncbi:MAG: amidohydrolase family protein [Coriobacteriales bacterium]|jgi:adenine deaminase|nr:amidohydrolase family protein [Coriobacteriales bacterium]